METPAAAVASDVEVLATVPELQAGQVLLCVAQPARFSAADRAWLLQVLDAEEQQRYERFRFERDRHIYLVAHAMTRALLARALTESDPRRLRFCQGPHGRPELAAMEASSNPLRFNLSHTHGMVACGLTWGADIGVDVEHVDRRLDMESLAPNVLASGELEQLRRLPHSGRRARFFEFWTLKEAYLKAVGQGLGLPLASIDFRPEGPSPVRGAQVEFGEGIADDPDRLRYSCWPLRPAHQLSLAVSCDAGAVRLAELTLDALRSALPGSSLPRSGPSR